MRYLPSTIAAVLKVGALTADVDRRLSLIQEELGEFGLFFRQFPRRDYGCHSRRVKWLQDANKQSSGIWQLLHQYEHDDNPLLHRLLQRAAQRYCCANKPRFTDEEMIRYKAEELSHTVNDTYWYAALFVASSSHGRTGELIIRYIRTTPPHLVGINRLINKLLRYWFAAASDKSLRILSILGPGGIGEFTTLYSQVYHCLLHQTREYCHSYQFSAAVPPNKIKSLICYIYEKITCRYVPVPASTEGIRFLMLRIRRELQYERYFILIDDLRDASVWEIIKHVFPNNNRGSRIIITTSNRSAARSCCSNPNGLVYKMKPWLMKKHQKTQEQERSEDWDWELSLICRELPPELMALLQYMGMFPRDYMSEKDCLGMKWMNEGLVHSEEEADEYFSELVDRDIFTRVAPNWEHNLDESEPCRWQVNSLMFTGDMLTRFLESPPIRTGNDIRVPRRLALHNLEPADSQGLMQASENVRSLAVSGVVDQVPLNKFKYLVVLDLGDWKNLKDEDLLQICNSKMYLLRYLSVKNTQVSKLPPQIKELRSLRTLDTRHTQISELPSEAFELEHLIKLDLRSTKIRKLSERIVGLQKLEYLLVGGDTTLGIIQYPLSFTTALGDLACLRVLATTCSFQQCTDKAYQDTWLSSMKNWRRLESLTIHCGPGSSLEFLLVLSSDPPMSLQKLKVTTGRFVSVPQWIKRLQHLSFLQITICKLAPDDLIMLRDLPKLKSLVLGLEFIPRVEIVIESEGFKELLKFSVDCPVPWLTFRQGAMPMLECLQLKLCSGPARQGSVPSGIWNLQRITEIVLCYNKKWCHNSSSVMMTVEAVKKEVAKHHNPIDLVINGIIHDVQEFDEATKMASEIQGEAGEGEAKDGVQAAGEETRRITSEIEEIEDGTQTGP